MVSTLTVDSRLSHIAGAASSNHGLAYRTVTLDGVNVDSAT
jgi:hypothetical protein